MREFLTNLFYAFAGGCLVFLFVVFVFSDAHEIDQEIISWKASLFEAP